jgi:hypothetical protein
LFTRADRRQIAARGLSVPEVERQVAQLLRPPRFLALDRPATPGDGIVVLPETDRPGLIERAERAAADGRVMPFIPASGAASRMFKELLACRARLAALPAEAKAAFSAATLREEAAAGDAASASVLAFVEGRDRFAFRDELRAAAEARGGVWDRLSADAPLSPLLDALLAPDGLAAAQRAKGLLEFHSSSDGPRTPFEEHMAEAASLWRDAAGRVRLHFTVSPEHRSRFESLLTRAQPRREQAAGARFEVEFSVQKPATDTVAVDLDGRPVRGDDASLLFRPAGHGALHANLGDLASAGGDLLYLKNIDNVVPDARRGPTLLWARLLTGLLLRALEEEGAALDRPVRVCGMVRNTGEPGGGPFWVRADDGSLSLQIVESAQVDPGSAAQQAILRSATHFNPVFLVCALRDPRGKPFDLDRFTDPDAVIVTRKSSGGADLLALERPGLWNGAMARWRTLFVEVPGEVFTPVKSVNDLLRPEHQP